MKRTLPVKGRFLRRAAGMLLVLALSWALGLPVRAQEAPPLVDAKGYVLMEAATGRVLAGENIHGRLPMASTTKIMTALLALEQPDLDRYFPVDGRAILVEGSSMGLLPGDQVTLRVLAAGMLLHSGNDSAGAAAVRVGKTVEGFVEMMNARAAGMGLADTHFVTPSGLDADGHYSSAYDMAVLAAQALQNPDFAAICSQSKMKVAFGNPPYDRWLTNHNRLLEQYEGAVGVKTGFTKKAGRCLVSAAVRDGVTLVCVTLSASDDWNAHRTLLDFGFSQVVPTDLRRFAGEVLIPVAGGETLTAAAGPEGSRWAGLLSGDRVEAETVLRPLLFAPAGKGQVVGEVRFFLEERCIGTLPVCLREDISPRPVPEGKNWAEKLREFWNLFWKKKEAGRATPAE
ncbi:MAG: D-alanyl-D-alanine carboxypeptidase [Oscillospiraceae bacterium]|nr:D-alanyl-D-alanine carboxypeptidase [Oscillospiraceae bacterium]